MEAKDAEFNAVAIPCPCKLTPNEISLDMFKPYCPSNLNIVGVKASGPKNKNNKKYKCIWSVKYMIKNPENYPTGRSKPYTELRFRKDIIEKVVCNRPRNTDIINHVRSERNQCWEFIYGILCDCEKDVVSPF